MQLITRVLVAALTAIAVLGVAAPAQAANPRQLEISVDGGATWYTNGAPALFSDLGSLIPGSSQTASILVRNTSGTSAVLRIAEIVDADSTPGLVADLEFTTSTTDVVGPTLRNVATMVCIPLLDGQVLHAGETGTIDVTITLDAASANGSQGGTAPIEFVVSLVENTGGALPAVSCTSGASSGGDRPATLPNTGSDWMTAAVLGGSLALALLGGGLVAVLASRRRRSTP